MARGAEPVGGDGVALLAERGLAQPAAVELDDGRAKGVTAERSVGLRLLAPQPMVHVHGGDAVAERSERVPEAGRVGAAGDETADLSAGLDQAVPADVLLDPHPEGRRVHGDIVSRLGGEERRDVATLGCKTCLRTGEQLVRRGREAPRVTHVNPARLIGNEAREASVIAARPRA